MSFIYVITQHDYDDCDHDVVAVVTDYAKAVETMREYIGAINMVDIDDDPELWDGNITLGDLAKGPVVLTWEDGSMMDVRMTQIEMTA